MTSGCITWALFCPAPAVSVVPPMASAAEAAARTSLVMLHPQSTTDVSPDVDVIGHPSQKLRRFERTEDRVRTWRIQVPEALRLALRQVQPGHLGKLRLNQTDPIAEVLERRLMHDLSHLLTAPQGPYQADGCKVGAKGGQHAALRCSGTNYFASAAGNSLAC